MRVVEKRPASTTLEPALHEDEDPPGFQALVGFNYWELSLHAPLPGFKRWFLVSSFNPLGACMHPAPTAWRGGERQAQRQPRPGVRGKAVQA